MKNKGLRLFAEIMLIIGGLNWGLVGFFDYNLVSSLFGETGFITKLIYDVVGLSAVYLAFPTTTFRTASSEKLTFVTAELVLTRTR